MFRSFQLLKNTFGFSQNLYFETVHRLDTNLKNMQAQNDNLKDTVEDFMTQIRQYKQACGLSETRYSFLEKDMQLSKEYYEDEINQLRIALTKSSAALATLKTQQKSKPGELSASQESKLQARLNFSPEKRVSEPRADPSNFQK